MLGNDVVDLGDAETCDGGSHPRFDARVFAPAELEALAASADPNRLRWCLWAAKEACFKLGVKRTPGLVFSPIRFVVSLCADLSGSVRYPAGVADVQLSIDRDSVHAIATERSAGRVVAGVGRIDGSLDASAAVRRLARERVAEQLDIAPTALHFARRGRVPTLEVREGRRSRWREIDLSLSHHGRYLAFACDVGGAAR